MPVHDELTLLVKSRYPVIFVESVDEQYVVDQLTEAAQSTGLALFEWSVTTGLKRRLVREPYPQSEKADQMLRILLGLLEASPDSESLFVLKDFHRYLDDSTVLRLFRDLVGLIRGRRSTVAIVAAQYRLPPEIESCAAYFVGGYPTEDEIIDCVSETLGDFHSENHHVGIQMSDAEQNKLIGALRGLTLQQIRNIIGQCLIENITMDARILPRVEQQKKKIFDRDGLLEYWASEKPSGLAGFSNLQQWLAARKDAFQDPSFRLPPPRGVLLMGVQGCGKSLAVKVIAGELGLPLYRLDLIRFYSKYIGETEQNLRKALKTIDQLAPICLWIDELEKNFAVSDGDIDGGVSQRLLGTFLTWMQERKPNCFVAATANDIHSLAPEFLRKGRFDEMFFVDLPDLETRQKLFEIHLARRGLDGRRFETRSLAELAADFSGAEIEQAVISALYQSGSHKEKLTTRHVAEEIRSTKPLAVVKSEDIAALRAWAMDRTVPA